ncbi:hypothetical protein MMC25_002486 [Agyrium rufum]|nr:hypothetical protein [Agyrium rufum]
MPGSKKPIKDETDPKHLDFQARDIRESSIYKSVRAYYHHLHAPAFGKVSGAEDPAVSPDGALIAVTGSIRTSLDQPLPDSRICIANVKRKDGLKVITRGSGNQHMPKWAPDGKTLGFLSDGEEKGIDEVMLLELGGFGEASPLVATSYDAKGKKADFVNGRVEYFSWSPDGKTVLLGVAGKEADAGDAAGSGKVSDGKKTDVPEWMPRIMAGEKEDSWRSVWVVDVEGGKAKKVSKEGTQVWEAEFKGNDAIVALVADGPGEETWYDAKIATINIEGGEEQIVYTPEFQAGFVTANPSGEIISLVDAVCSDRGIVAGNVSYFADGKQIAVDTKEVDVTHLAWSGDEKLFYDGVRGLANVAGVIEWKHGKAEATELWSTHEATGYFYPVSCPIPDSSNIAIILHSWERYPEIMIVEDGELVSIHSLAHEGSKWARAQVGERRALSWPGRDGLEIQGYLDLPKDTGKQYPLILNVHGGPIWAHLNRWGQSPLVAQGYAVLSTNPRGSGGRGQKFAHLELGDIGGEEVHDHLQGIKSVVEHAIVDPERIGVTGSSHGGFMSSWIITQSDIFKASVPQAAVNDWWSLYSTSNIGLFERFFFKVDPYEETNKYIDVSPVKLAGRYKTPVLQTAGADDLCVPVSQGLQYHQALKQNGVKDSVLVVYPGEGHGVRKWPAYFDLMARSIGWFERFMPSDAKGLEGLKEEAGEDSK